MNRFRKVFGYLRVYNIENDTSTFQKQGHFIDLNQEFATIYVKIFNLIVRVGTQLFLLKKIIKNIWWYEKMC